MVQPNRPTNQCYAVLAVTVLFVIILYILIPIVVDKTKLDDKCDSEDKEITSKVTNIILGDAVNNSIGYDTNGADGVTIHNFQQDKSLETQGEDCSLKRYAVYFYWIPIACLIILWFILLFCILCTEYTCYSCCSTTEKQQMVTEDTSAKRCRAIRAQMNYFKFSRYKSKFNDHPMLLRLHRKNNQDQQLLTYIKKYCDKAWQLRPNNTGKTKPTKYTMKIRQVYKIDNPKVWEEYNGDKSQLHDIIQKLIHKDAMQKLSVKLQRKTLGPQDDAARSVTPSTAASIRQENVESQPEDDASNHDKDEPKDEEVVSENAVSDSENEAANSGNNGSSDENNDSDDENESVDENETLMQHEDDDVTDTELEIEDEVSLKSADSISLLGRSWNDINFHDKGDRDSCLFLMHGTQITNAFNTVENGFDINKAHNGYYGRTIQLTESSWLADKYTDSKEYPRSSNHVMFIVRTSLKQAYWRLNNEHVPPSISKNYAALVSGDEKGRREFKVFNSKNCYPEFLVLYDRIYTNTYWPRRNTNPMLDLP